MSQVLIFYSMNKFYKNPSDILRVLQGRFRLVRVKVASVEFKNIQSNFQAFVRINKRAAFTII